MNALKYRFQDLYRYLIPGVFAILIFAITPSQIQGLSEIINLKNEIDWKTGIAILFIGYIVGLIINRIGKFIYYRIVIRFWPVKFHKKTSILTRSEKFVLIRQFSPANHQVVETWIMMKGSCTNLATTFVILTIVSMIKILQFNCHIILWIFLFVSANISAVLLFDMARSYHKEANEDLTNSIIKLNLIEKGLESKIPNIELHE